MVQVSQFGSGFPSPRRWLWGGIGVCCWVMASGCAEWKAFCQNRGPSGPRITEDMKHPPLGVDAFSGQVVKRDTAHPPTELARSTTGPQSGPASGPSGAGATLAQAPSSPPPGAIELPRAGEVDRLKVSLQPPSPMPPRNRPANLPRSEPAAVKASTSQVSRGGSAPAPASAPASASAQPKGPTPDVVMRTVVASARERLERIATYQVRLTREERVGDAMQPPEDVLLSIRRSPRAVRIEWTDGPHKGREVLYAADRDGGLMHINMADAVVPMPRISMAPDSPMAVRNSRHPITEAGIDTILRNLERSIDRHQAGETRLSYGGVQSFPGLARPCHTFKETRTDGEVWIVCIDPETRLPAMVQGNSADGGLLERYLFRDLRADLPELAAAEAFDPDARWGPPQGLFQRLARSNESKQADAPADVPQ